MRRREEERGIRSERVVCGEKQGETEEGRRGQFCTRKSPKCKGRKSRWMILWQKIPPATGQADVLTEVSR